MDEILAELTKYPVKTRLSLTGPLVVARDIAHAKIKERLDAGEEMPQYLKDHPVYYAGPAKTPEGYASGSFGPTTAGRMDSYVEQFQAAGGSKVMLAKGNRSQAGHRRVRRARRLLPRLHRRPGGPAGPGLHQEGRGPGVRGARHGGGLEDRGRGLPGVHRRRRQGQRLLPGPGARRRRSRAFRCARATDASQYPHEPLAPARGSWHTWGGRPRPPPAAAPDMSDPRLPAALSTIR